MKEAPRNRHYDDNKCIAITQFVYVEVFESNKLIGKLILVLNGGRERVENRERASEWARARMRTRAINTLNMVFTSIAIFFHVILFFVLFLLAFLLLLLLLFNAVEASKSWSWKMAFSEKNHQNIEMVCTWRTIEHCTKTLPIESALPSRLSLNKWLHINRLHS